MIKYTHPLNYKINYHIIIDRLKLLIERCGNYVE